jgi:hypothetical protein
MTMLQDGSFFSVGCPQKSINKAGQSLVVKLLRDSKVPPKIINLASIAYLYGVEPHCFNHGIDFGWSEKDHQELHQVGQEKAGP